MLLLNLSHNSISSDFLSELTFASQLKLVALDLSYNNLKAIKVRKKNISDANGRPPSMLIRIQKAKIAENWSKSAKNLNYIFYEYVI